MSKMSFLTALFACASRMPIASSSPPAECAEVDMPLDLRAWPTGAQLDVPQESAYEASKFRGLAPKGTSVDVYPQQSYGFTARFHATTERAALDVCDATVAAYLPGAPVRHPLEPTLPSVPCRRCPASTP